MTQLDDVTTVELRAELRRRECAAGGHAPTEWAALHEPGVRRSVCRCGSHKWELRRCDST